MYNKTKISYNYQSAAVLFEERRLKNMTAEIYHLFHSGTVVKYNNKLYIFDYYKDELDSESEQDDNLSSLEKGIIRRDSFEDIEETIIFVSLDHHDHYNKVIFDWEDYCHNCTYILADQVNLEAELSSKDNLYQIEADQELRLEDLTVKTYGSTDEGVSFLVKADGLNIFHAGDLNWWKWKKFSHRVQKREERGFKREIDKIIGEKIDIAFVPVDPRLEEYYYLAGEYFIEQIKPGIFIPIHFSSNFKIIKKFKSKMAADLKTEIAEIGKRGEKIFYKI
jgi:L-ascorbate metabolism protein UlaG (beta-lactamase superfamily)